MRGRVRVRVRGRVRVSLRVRVRVRVRFRVRVKVERVPMRPECPLGLPSDCCVPILPTLSSASCDG